MLVSLPLRDFLPLVVFPPRGRQCERAVLLCMCLKRPKSKPQVKLFVKLSLTLIIDGKMFPSTKNYFTSCFFVKSSI